MKRESVREALARGVLLFDGALGTYARILPGFPEGPVERACLTAPDQVAAIHRAYKEAGCRAIKTNTFAAHVGQAAWDAADQRALARSAAAIARGAAGEEALVFADIGPAPTEERAAEEYLALAACFPPEETDGYLFETLPSLAGIEEAAERIKAARPDAFIHVSFAANPDGITRSGESVKALLQAADACPFIDALGLNCLCGASHMRRLLEGLPPLGKPLSVMPNAGYPRLVNGRIAFESDPGYYADQLMDCVSAGARIIGGCCGTTPAYIREAAARLAGLRRAVVSVPAADAPPRGAPRSRILDKLRRGEKPILVELDPPRSADTAVFLSGAQALSRAGADAITIADCPIGRASMDACLLAAKLKREYGIEPLPHMTCRDRNLNATKALLLGLSMEQVDNVLVVTGDPVPREERDSVKAVFQFNSQVLARLIGSLADHGQTPPFFVCGALNVNAVSFEQELARARLKEEAGIMAFLTQPILSRRAAENLKKARAALKGYLFAGLFPIVSYKNACFLQNEVAGMTVDDDILQAYQGLDRAQGEAMARKICREAARAVQDAADGYYIMTPFQRVSLVAGLMADLRALSRGE